MKIGQSLKEEKSDGLMFWIALKGRKNGLQASSMKVPWPQNTCKIA
jgi:hypothetical protein